MVPYNHFHVTNVNFGKCVKKNLIETLAIFKIMVYNKDTI